MKKADVIITKDSSGYNIKVEGRATFETSVPLKRFADSFKNEKVEHINIDLGECVWMDSTFMGTLAILGLKAKDINIKPVIWNIDDKNYHLMNDLGITILFELKKGDEIKGKDWNASGSPQFDDKKADLSDTILKAHETLIDIDSNNLKKFDKVVEMIKKDINK